MQRSEIPRHSSKGGRSTFPEGFIMLYAVISLVYMACSSTAARMVMRRCDMCNLENGGGGGRGVTYLFLGLPT